MKEWKHLTFEQRKVIANGISHNYKLKDIAEALGFDPTSISKEVKRNRDSVSIGKNITNCKKVNRWPYVCSGCISGDRWSVQYCSEGTFWCNGYCLVLPFVLPFGFTCA